MRKANKTSVLAESSEAAVFFKGAENGGLNMLFSENPCFFSKGFNLFSFSTGEKDLKIDALWNIQNKL